MKNILVESRSEADMKVKNLKDELVEKERTVSEALEQSKKSLKIEKEIEKKYKETEDNLKETLKEKEFLKMLNDRLIMNQKEWKEKFDNMKKELERNLKLKSERIRELEDENHDLMMFIEGQKTVEKHSEELSGASMTTTPPMESMTEPEQQSSSHMHGRKNRKNNRSRK